MRTGALLWVLIRRADAAPTEVPCGSGSFPCKMLIREKLVGLRPPSLSRSAKRKTCDTSANRWGGGEWLPNGHPVE